MTGDLNRTISLGIDPATGEMRTFSFNSFTFPACTTCNTEFSDLEGKAKPLLIGLINGKSLNSLELSTFLDWLDKVRVGLWLGFHYLDKNPLNIDPQFHISTRLGQKDRMFALYRIREDRTGFQMAGVNTPVFHMSPSCVLLAINSIFILSLSWDFLLAARLGFPFPKDVKLGRPDGSPMYLIDVSSYQAGTERCKYPVIRTGMLEPSFQVFQAIARREALENFSSLFQSQYVQEHSIDPRAGLGKIFLSKEGRTWCVLNVGEKIETIGGTSYPISFLNDRLLIQTMELQNWQMASGPGTSDLPKEEQQAMRRYQKALTYFNKQVIRRMRKDLRK